MTTTIEDKRVPKVPTRQKSKERFEFLLYCAEELLENGTPPEELSIPEVSKKAGLPPQAVYRLFPSPAALLHGLADRHMKRLLKLYRESDLEDISSWQEGVNLCVDRCTDYYNRHPMAMELILGSGVSREIQVADRTNNQLLAEQAGLFLAESTGMETPEGLLKRLEISMDIADAIWRHSYFEHRCITPFYISESKIALISYMEQYLPRRSY